MWRHSLVYIAARTLMLAAIIMVLWTIPYLRENMVALVLLAMTLSMVGSFFLLRPLRDRISASYADQREGAAQPRQLTDEEIEDRS